MTRLINIAYGIVSAIRKHIMIQNAGARAHITVRIDESGEAGVVVPGVQIIERWLSAEK